MAFDEVSGLFVGMGVIGKDAIFIEEEFGHEGMLAEDEGFLADAWERGGVVVGGVLLEHGGLVSPIKWAGGLVWKVGVGWRCLDWEGGSNWEAARIDQRT